MTNDRNPASQAVTHAAAAQETAQADLKDLREHLARGRAAGLSEDTLAELEQSLCRLMSELKAADEPAHQNGSTHG